MAPIAIWRQLVMAVADHADFLAGVAYHRRSIWHLLMTVRLNLYLEIKAV